MGEAKRKKKRTRDFLKLPENGQCVFCGGKPETMDHFPPRSYFYKREGPEGYEFPSCVSCNKGKSKKEIAIVLLLKLQDLRAQKDPTFGKFLNLVRKHHPEVIDELKLLTGSAAKRTRRDVTGDVETAAQLAVMGYEFIELGASSTHLYKELCEWLARTLYFHHLKRVFLDEVYKMYLARAAYSDPMLKGFFDGHSGQPQVCRNGKDLRKLATLAGVADDAEESVVLHALKARVSGQETAAQQIATLKSQIAALETANKKVAAQQFVERMGREKVIPREMIEEFVSVHMQRPELAEKLVGALPDVPRDVTDLHSARPAVTGESNALFTKMDAALGLQTEKGGQSHGA